MTALLLARIPYVEPCGCAGVMTVIATDPCPQEAVGRAIRHWDGCVVVRRQQEASSCPAS